MMLNEIQCEIILTLADTSLCVAETARKMHFHRNTIKYHIDLTKRDTGLDPLNFADMEKLLWLIADEAAERELKKCPFCGGDAVVEITPIKTGGFRATVRCTGCPVGIVTPKNNTRVDAEECATAMWNRRVKANG